MRRNGSSIVVDHTRSNALSFDVDRTNVEYILDVGLKASYNRCQLGSWNDATFGERNIQTI